MSGELAIVGGEKYPVLANSQNVGAVILGNLAGEAITVGDLNRIKVPSGGGTTWEVMGPDGEAKPFKALDGVIIYTARRRAYWESLTPSNDPPNCFSQDTYTGVGNPGGKCEVCPHNEWGSQRRQDGAAGRGKACKEVRLIFLLREGAMLPDVVSVPVGSLKDAKQYLLKLSMPYTSVITRMSLERVKNKDNIDYAKIKFAKVGVLSEEAFRSILEYARSMQSLFEQTKVESEEALD